MQVVVPLPGQRSDPHMFLPKHLEIIIEGGGAVIRGNGKTAGRTGDNKGSKKGVNFLRKRTTGRIMYIRGQGTGHISLYTL